jgi:hypothetical protein
MNGQENAKTLGQKIENKKKCTVQLILHVRERNEPTYRNLKSFP